MKLIAEGLTARRSPRRWSSAEDRRPPPRQLLEKLGMRNRVELTRYAIDAGLVEP